MPAPAAPDPGLAAAALPLLLASVLFLVSAALPMEEVPIEPQAAREKETRVMARTLVMVV